MDYLFSAIKLEGDFANYIIKDTENDRLSHLLKINLFVGANNSGKSRFIRTLFKESNLQVLNTTYNGKKINELMNAFRITLKEFLNRYHIIDINEVIKNADEISDVNQFLSINSDFLFTTQFHDLMERIKKTTIQSVVSKSANVGGSYSLPDVVNLLKKIGQSYQTKIDPLIENEKKYEYKKIYIPTLRGLRNLEDLNGNNKNLDVYKERTKKDYFKNIELDGTQEIFTGLNLYDEVKKLLLGHLEDRESIHEYEKFLSDIFFDKQQITLIPSLEDEVLNVKIGEEKEQPIYNLGDGIQSIIIITFPIFKYRDIPLYVFLEEPELYLHPGMQRKLINVLSNEKFKLAQFFISTHSNHFLDISLDFDNISIYTFCKNLSDDNEREKLPQCTINNVSHGNYNLLSILGVKNSSVFLSNCTIWVEGITDRLYLRKYLEILQKNKEGQPVFEEDIHYSFVEYGGGNIKHWDFLDDREENELSKPINIEQLCSKLFLITDKDSSSSKDSYHEQLQKKLGERYYCLHCREIENLLSKEILCKVIAKYENIDEKEYVKFDCDLSEELYHGEYLGKFIDEHLENKRRRGPYGSESGTIKNKLDFCKKSTSEMHNINDLSQGAKELVEKIYQFIKQCNNK